MRKELLIIILAATCITSCKNNLQESSKTLEQYTESAAMSVYMQEPERALTIIDSAVIAGNIDPDKADYLRAVVYYGGLHEPVKAKTACYKLLTRDDVENEDLLHEQIYTLLAIIAHAESNDLNVLQYATQAYELALKLGFEDDAVQMASYITLSMAHKGDIDSAIVRMEEIRRQALVLHTLGGEMTYISVVKSLMHILYDSGRYDEILSLAEEALAELARFEVHPEQCTDLPENFDTTEFVDYSRGQLYTHMALAYGGLHKSAEAHRYLAQAKHSIWAQKPSFDFTILPMYIELHEWEEVERVFEKADAMQLTDTLNYNFIRFLLLRMQATRQQGRYDEALGFCRRALSMQHDLADQQMQQQIAEQMALYELHNEKLSREREHARTHFIIVILILVIFVTIIIGIIAAYSIITKRRIKEKNRTMVKMINELNARKRKTLISVENKDSKEIYRQILERTFAERLYADLQMNRENFAAQMNISRHELNDLLSANTDGLSFPQWLNNIRLERACTLLQNEPDKPIKDIAEAVGLTPNNFLRLFRQQYGITPTEYRKNREISV